MLEQRNANTTFTTSAVRRLSKATPRKIEIKEERKEEKRPS